MNMDDLVAKRSVVDNIKEYIKKKKDELQYRKEHEEEILKGELEKVKAKAAKIKRIQSYKKEIAANKSYVSSNTGWGAMFKQPDIHQQASAAKKKLRDLKAINRYNAYKKKLDNYVTGQSTYASLIGTPQQHDYGFNSFAPKKSKKSNNIFDF